MVGAYTGLTPYRGRPPTRPAAPGLALHISRGAYAGLWAGTILGLWSLAIYFANVWQHFIYPEAVKKAH